MLTIGPCECTCLPSEHCRCFCKQEALRASARNRKNKAHRLRRRPGSNQPVTSVGERLPHATRTPPHGGGRAGSRDRPAAATKGARTPVDRRRSSARRSLETRPRASAVGCSSGGKEDDLRDAGGSTERGGGRREGGGEGHVEAVFPHGTERRLLEHQCQVHREGPVRLDLAVHVPACRGAKSAFFQSWRGAVPSSKRTASGPALPSLLSCAREQYRIRACTEKPAGAPAAS